MSPPVVAHLVRCADGVEACRRFISSYRAHDAGCGHELVLLCKGFPADSLPQEWERSVAGVVHRRVHLPDDGFDLGAYRRALPGLQGRHVLFLNGHAQILAVGWLDLFMRHAAPGRLIGATASWNSHRRDRMTACPPWLVLRRRLVSRLWRAWLSARASWDDLAPYLPFPNPHVRTNAFLLPPDLHRLVLAWPVPSGKADCHALESGRDGLSRQVLAGG
ncbi:MAG: hypothetical protein J0M02_18495, partial [Planctomycetes bacterium]|nr:hypothetical protein [Planctomycetota bacterium]